jgi:hypothetical protein
MDYAYMAWEADVGSSELIADGADWAECCGVHTSNGITNLLFRWADKDLYVKQLPDNKVFLRSLNSGESGVFDGVAFRNASDKVQFFNDNF